MTCGTPTAGEAVTWRRAHLEFAQSRAPTGSQLLRGDLLLLTSSWERRCTEVTRAAHGEYRRAAVVRFAERGRSGRREAHDELLLGFAARVAGGVADVPPLEIAAVLDWHDALTRLVGGVRDEVGRAIDLVVDLSCLPKYYALLLLGYCLRTGAARSVTLFYAEGRYAPADSNVSLATDHAFTAGDWSAVQVPYFEGRQAFGRGISILASIGFETFQARKLIQTHEADHHVLVAPSPGFSPEYEERSEAEVRALCTALDLPMGEVLRASAGDAVATAELVIGVVDGQEGLNEVGLCLGTKPQALGFGLAALIRPDLTLVCRFPESYAETETPPTGTSWAYRVGDLSSSGA